MRKLNKYRHITGLIADRPSSWAPRFRLGILLASLLVFVAVCQAAPTALIVVDGNVIDFEEAVVSSNLSAALTTAGYTVTQNTGLPGTITSYKQIWDIRYNNVLISGSDATAYSNYLAAGGSLFVVGENATAFGTRDTSISSLVSSVGGGTVTPINAANAQTVVLAPFTTTPYPVTSITFSNAGGSTSTGTGAAITKDGSNVATSILWSPVALGKSGAMIVVFDVDFINVAYTGVGGDPTSLSYLYNLIGYLNSPGPYITSVTPNSGPIGTSVVIAGYNFGATKGSSTLLFNGTLATSVASWGANSISAIVPTGTTTGNVWVVVGGQTSNGVPFTVTGGPAPVPTLSQSALLLLACCLIGIGAWSVRRRQGPSAS